MPRFAKGSQEAKEWGERMKAKRAESNTNKEPKIKKDKLPKIDKSFVVDIPLVNTPELDIPEYFAQKLVNKKGKVSYRLVNPLTKTRNLSSRGGEKSVKIVRKPIEDAVLLEHSNEPIPLSLFNLKDRKIIDNHFKKVRAYKKYPVVEVPKSVPFKNKERGRPEKLPKNIEINKKRKNEETEEEEKGAEEKPKKRRGPKTELTEAERIEKQREQKKEWAKKNREKKKAEKAEKEGKGLSDMFMTPFKNMAKDWGKVGKTAKKTANTVIYGATDYSPKVRKIISSYGPKHIVGITIGRTPVSEVLTKILSTASSNFKENLDNSPYDTLFHLFILIKLEGGTEVRLEKNEVINMDLIRKSTPDTEFKEVSNIPSNMTLNNLLQNTQKVMGDQFFKYSARDNNCQDFILAVFTSNNIGNQQDKEFIKQDTKSLFENTGLLRKFANTITETGARVNALTQGGRLNKKGVINQYGKILNHLTEHIKDPNEPIDPKDYKQSKELIDEIKQIKGGEISGDYKLQSIVFDKSKYSIKESKKWLKENGYKHSKVDEEENTLRFRQISPNIIKKQGFTEYRTKELGNSGIKLILAYKNKISGNGIMPRVAKGSKEAKEWGERMRSMRGKKKVESDSESDDEMEGGTLKDLVNKGVGEARKISGYGRPTIRDLVEKGAEEARKVSGYGIHHHHHYYFGGKGMWDWADPKKNGVAKAFDPNQNGVAKTFTKDVPSALIHQGIPMATGAVGSTLGEVGGPLGAMAGAYAGKKLGEMGAEELGKKTGYGFKKGSEEAKKHMAKIRAMRKKK